ncbi:synaptotagmin-like protein 2 isoform X2 [Gouania willdenowi]|uniref:synaptotagmin-like protein 2 isoform X2 n=1 Tax=Gouania willdenowi TaxID=441366 RepID=UPI0010567957|nr:synaptotagmin-like protein 2 isoform X2 [Gouania willdenowi]
MIDLSFLTEEEQESIQSVLRRDAELKRIEEQRVQNLQRSVSDRDQLRYLTGDWFYETKQHRHPDRIHGCDIIRASMKHTQKPETMKTSYIVPEKSSFISGESEQDLILVSSILIHQEPHMQLGHERIEIQNISEITHGSPKPALQSPLKRKNPFNIEHVVEEKKEQSVSGEVELNQAVEEKTISSSSSETIPFPVKPNALIPLPENKVFDTSSTVCSVNIEHTQDVPISLHAVFQDLLDTYKPNYTIDNCANKKQVRFCSAIGPNGVKCQDGKELGEHGLLDSDHYATSETQMANNSHRDSTNALQPHLKTNHLDSTEGALVFKHGTHFQEQQAKKTLHIGDISEHSHYKLQRTEFSSSSVISVEQESDKAVPSEKQSEHSHHVQEAKDGLSLSSVEASNNKQILSNNQILPKPRQIMFGMLNIDEPEKTSYPAKITLKEKPPAEIKTAREIKMLQITALQNPMTTLEFETRGDKLGTCNVQSSEQLSSSNAFCERKSSGIVKIPITEKISLEGISKTVRKFSPNPQSNSEFRNVSNIVYPQMERKEDTTSSSLQSDDCLFVDLSKEDGTYRADPVLVCEGTDDSVVDMQISCQQNKSSSQHHDVTETCLNLSSSISQEVTASKPSELKHLSAIEYPQPKVIRVKVNGASSSALLSDKEAQTLDNGPVCQWYDESMISGKQLRSPSEAADERPCQVQAQTKSPERRLSQDKTPFTRSVKQNDDVRRSPSKTCHPKVLPRDSSGDTRSGVPGSPLKTFPIDINHQTNSNDNHMEKSTSPNVSSRTSKSTKLSGTCTDITNFSSDDKTTVIPGAQWVSRDYGVYIPFKNSPRITSSIPRKKDGGSSQDIMTRTQPLSRTTLEEKRNPIDGREQKMLSTDDVDSMFPCDSHTTIKSSVSVPILLQQDETDSDNALETNLRCRRNTSSSTSNISLSSGMASMSSISGSMSSIYNGDVSDVEVQGNIQFAVNYIQKLGEFHIFVVLCRGLAVTDTRRSCSDPFVPAKKYANQHFSEKKSHIILSHKCKSCLFFHSYVKCYLLPDKTKLGKRKTTVKKKTLNPSYNEILRFKVSMEVLKTQNLNISVWHNETFGRNSFLGQVDLDLSEWDFSNTRINDYTLKDRVSTQTSPSGQPDSRGHMRLALRFLPQTSHSKRTSKMESGEVQIWVKDCKKLSPARGLIIDPFVKCTVLPDTSRKSRQKTRVVKRTANPMFNHTMVYDGFRPEDLREACVEITVWDHDRLNNHYVGGLRLGLGTGKSYGTEVPWMDSTPSEAGLWQRMLQCDSEWVEDILPLRMLVIAKSMHK